MVGPMMQSISTPSFVLPGYLSDNNSPTLFRPTYQTLKDIELRVLDIFHTKKISKRSLFESGRDGRRYLVYDRPPKKKMRWADEEAGAQEDSAR